MSHMQEAVQHKQQSHCWVSSKSHSWVVTDWMLQRQLFVQLSWWSGEAEFASAAVTDCLRKEFLAHAVYALWHSCPF